MVLTRCNDRKKLIWIGLDIYNSLEKAVFQIMKIEWGGKTEKSRGYLGQKQVVFEKCPESRNKWFWIYIYMPPPVCWPPGGQKGTWAKFRFLSEIVQKMFGSRILPSLQTTTLQLGWYKNLKKVWSPKNVWSLTNGRSLTDGWCLTDVWLLIHEW